MAADKLTPDERATVGPDWLRRIGVRSWYLVGIVALLVVVLYLVGRASAIVVPFLLAIILGVLFAPVVDMLEKRRIPRQAGAAIVMVLIVGAVATLGWFMIQSLATEVPIIQARLASALTTLQAWLTSLHLPESTVNSITSGVKVQVPKASGAAAGIVFSGLSSIAGLAFGAFISMYMLFFTLVDSAKLACWVGAHMGLPEKVGQAIVADSGASVRQYFRGTSILALVTSAATGIGLALARVPLLVPIMVITFVMVFIPYIGAVLASTFAVLIALGAGGPQMALFALIVVVFVQNGLQGAVAGVVLGNALDLHPLVVIMSTMLGGVFAGILGAMLGAPVTAIVVRAIGHLGGTSAATMAPSTVPPTKMA